MSETTRAWFANNWLTTTEATISTEGSLSSNVTSAEVEKNYYLIFSYFFFGLTIVVSNCIVVIVVVKSENLHKPTLWNIAFMAICDLLYALHYIIFTVPSLLLGSFAYSEKLIPVASVSMTLLFGQNVLNIHLTLVDRFIAIVWPLSYQRLMSANRFLIAVLTMVVINIGRMCLIAFPNGVMYYNSAIGVCLVNFNTFIAGAASVGLPFLIIILNVVLLVIIAIKMKERKKLFPTISSVKTYTFTVTMSLAATVFMLCYVPICISIIANVIYGAENLNMSFVQVGIIFLLSNSFWNVVIYATTYRPFRDGVQRLFCEKRFRDKKRREIHREHTKVMSTIS